MQNTDFFFFYWPGHHNQWVMNMNDIMCVKRKSRQASHHIKWLVTEQILFTKTNMWLSLEKNKIILMRNYMSRCDHKRNHTSSKHVHHRIFICVQLQYFHLHLILSNHPKIIRFLQQLLKKFTNIHMYTGTLIQVWKHLEHPIYYWPVDTALHKYTIIIPTDIIFFFFFCKGLEWNIDSDRYLPAPSNGFQEQCTTVSISAVSCITCLLHLYQGGWPYITCLSHSLPLPHR